MRYRGQLVAALALCASALGGFAACVGDDSGNPDATTPDGGGNDATTQDVQSSNDAVVDGPTGCAARTADDTAQINDPENPTTTLLEGRERVRGVELSADGHMTSHLELTAGYSFLDGVTSGTQGSVAPVLTFTRAPVPNLAPHAGHIWMEYDFGHGWEAGVGVNAQGRRVGNVLTTGALPAYVPAYAVSSAMLKTQIGPRATLQLNLINLLNTWYFTKVYYASPSENHVLPGPGRTARLNLIVAF